MRARKEVEDIVVNTQFGVHMAPLKLQAFGLTSEGRGRLRASSPFLGPGVFQKVKAEENMDPIAITAATLVAKWAAEGFAKEVGKSAWEGLKKIYDVVSVKFTGDDESSEVLQRLEQKPSSEARTNELAEVLDESLKADPPFARELRRLVEEAGAQAATSSFVTQVMDNARVGKITNIGTITGPVNF